MPRSLFSQRRRSSFGKQPLAAGESIRVQDSIDPTRWADSPDAKPLSNIFWQPAEFEAVATPGLAGDLTLQFPSPLPSGNPDWDTVVLDWNFARDETGQVKPAPAVLVLDILQGGNRVSGFIARTLAKAGLHAFVMHLPQNGRRLRAGTKHDWNYFLPTLLQGATDARRARDVIASLPMVTGPIGLQGTSLGGFIATIAASLDNAFDKTVFALAGGDVFGVLTTGKMDAARVRQRLLNAGYTDDKLRDWLWPIEPLRLAHRLNPKTTWLFTARHDQVVPANCSHQLAQTIGLSWQHHRHLTGCHYSCVINAQRFLSEMTQAFQAPLNYSRSPISVA